MTRRAGAFPGLPVGERAEELLLQASLRLRMCVRFSCTELCDQGTHAIEPNYRKGAIAVWHRIQGIRASLDAGGIGASLVVRSMAVRAESDQILGSVITQSAPRLNGGLEDLPLARTIGNASRLAPGLHGRVGDRLQDQASSVVALARIPVKAPPARSSRSCFRCGFGRPSTSRVRADRRASWLPVSKLTPARKSAQIISRQ